MYTVQSVYTLILLYCECRPLTQWSTCTLWYLYNIKIILKIFTVDVAQTPAQRPAPFSSTDQSATTRARQQSVLLEEREAAEPGFKAPPPAMNSRGRPGNRPGQSVESVR